MLTWLVFMSAANNPGERRQLNLYYSTQFFTDTVKQWEQYDDGAMGISVRHIKRYVDALVKLWRDFLSASTSTARLTAVLLAPTCRCTCMKTVSGQSRRSARVVRAMVTAVARKKPRRRSRRRGRRLQLSPVDVNPCGSVVEQCHMFQVAHIARAQIWGAVITTRSVYNIYHGDDVRKIDLGAVSQILPRRLARRTQRHT